MTVELPPETQRDPARDASEETSMDDLLRALLVDEVKVRVDPVTGRAILDGAQAGQDRT